MTCQGLYHQLDPRHGARKTRRYYRITCFRMKAPARPIASLNTVAEVHESPVHLRHGKRPIDVMLKL